MANAKTQPATSHEILSACYDEVRKLQTGPLTISSIEKFRVHTRLDKHVVLLRLFPSISPDTIGHFLKPPIKGVVLQCYGAGNVPRETETSL